jgi:hypothetical protein
VLHADRDHAARARRQPITSAVENQRGIPREHVKALLERLYVQVEMAAGVELGQAPSRVNRTD